MELAAQDSMHYCCFSYRDAAGRQQGHVKTADLDGGTFPLADLRAGRERIRRAIAEGREEVCLRCPQLASRDWSPSPYAIRSMTINSWTECNLRCEYCFTLKIEKHHKVAYDLFGIVFDILRRGLLDPAGLVVWGGGDVSALHDFEAISRMLSHYGVAQQIKTSGIKYSPATEAVLSSGKGLVEISLDAGTRATYQAVKGRDMFDAVVANIHKYAAAGPLALKYIVLEKNQSRVDLEGFVALCQETGIRYVTVTPEWDGLFAGRFDDASLGRAAWLIHTLRGLGIRVIPGNDDEMASFFHGHAPRLGEWLQQLEQGRLGTAEVFADAGPDEDPTGA